MVVDLERFMREELRYWVQAVGLAVYVALAVIALALLATTL